MSRQSTVEVSVGFFLLLGIISLAMLALQVSGLSDFYTPKSGYQIKAEFTNIGGLKPRAKVALAGVTIGRVERIDLDRETLNAVVNISLQNVANLPNDSKFNIVTAGLLGDNYISVEPGFSDDYLKNNDFVSSADTGSAVILEELISKFVSNKASEESSGD